MLQLNRQPLPPERGAPKPENTGDEYSWRPDYFLKETAALRGQIEAERRLNPDREAELRDLAKRLGIEPPLHQNYQIFRELWAAEHNEQVYLAPSHSDLLFLSRCP